MKKFFSFKKLGFVLTFAAIMALTGATVFAEEPGFEVYDMTAAMQTSMTALGTQIFAIIAIAVPVILSIVGGKMAISKGISVFKSLVGKG